jgi:hypothetical protein
MYPLLSYATNLQNPEAEVLIEEALKCWGVALAVEPAVAPQLVGLLGNMSHLLRRGKDNSAAFQILEAYLLLQVRFGVIQDGFGCKKSSRLGSCPTVLGRGTGSRTGSCSTTSRAI